MTIDAEPPQRASAPSTPWAWRRSRPSARYPFATLVACAACLAIWAFVVLGPSDTMSDRMQAAGWAPATEVWDGRPWVLITSAFVHSDPLHVAFNVYWLWRLGSVLELEIGAARWIAFCAAAAFVSSAAELAISGEVGIGESGIGYAIFGLLWVGRSRVPSFASVLPDKWVRLFVGWLVLCFVLTYTDVWVVGNWAHLGGLLFGATVGAAVGACSTGRHRICTGAAAALLVAASGVLAVWCPWAWGWAGARALRAHRASDFSAAESWYRRSLELGADAAWVWKNLALVHASTSRTDDMLFDIDQLAAIDKAQARAFEASPAWEHFAPAVAYRRRDFAGALRLYERLRERDADPAYCWDGIVRCRIALGQMDAARAALAELRRIDATTGADLDAYFAK